MALFEQVEMGIHLQIFFNHIVNWEIGIGKTHGTRYLFRPQNEPQVY